MGFDVEGAKRAGYSDQEIQDYLRSKGGGQAPVAPQAASPEEGSPFLGTFSSRESYTPMDFMNPISTATQMLGGMSPTALKAGVNAWGVEAIKALAQRLGAHDVEKWADKELEKFYSSGSRGGFFESGSAEVGRRAAEMLASGGIASAISKGAAKLAIGKAMPLAGPTGQTFVAAPAGGAAISTTTPLERDPTTGEMSSGLERAVWAAAMNAGMALPFNYFLGLKDLVKQMAASEGKGWGRVLSFLTPVGGKRVNTPIPLVSSPEHAAGQALEDAGRRLTGDAALLTVGQKGAPPAMIGPGGQPVTGTPGVALHTLNREKMAFQQPGGLLPWQEVNVGQAATSEALARQARGAQINPGEVGNRIRFEAQQELAGQNVQREMAFNNWRTSQGGDSAAREVAMTPYVNRLIDLFHQHSRAGGMIMTPQEYGIVRQEIARRLEQAVFGARGRGSANEIQALLEEVGGQAFGGASLIESIKTQASRRVANLVKDSLEETLRLSAQAGHAPSKGLMLARRDFAIRSEKMEKLEDLLGPAFKKSNSGEDIVRALLDTKSPSRTKEAIDLLGSFSPRSRDELRMAYKNVLYERGIHTNPEMMEVAGALRDDPTRGFSPGLFVSGRPKGKGVNNAEALLYEELLTPEDRRLMETAYNYARKASTHEIVNPGTYSAELQQSRSAGQAGGGAAAIGFWKSFPYILRAIIHGEFPRTWLRLLHSAEGQKSLANMTDWTKQGARFGTTVGGAVTGYALGPEREERR